MACSLKTTVPLITALLLFTGCGDVSSTTAEPFDPDKAAQVWNTADKNGMRMNSGYWKAGKVFVVGVVLPVTSKPAQAQLPSAQLR